jgi:adenine phosphoribosyltransferase
MGIPLTTMLSHRLNVPYTIIRKRQYHLPKEICVTQNTGYTTTPLYINGITADERLIFVDDIISTGGTFEAINEGLKRKNHIKAGFFILDKGTRMKQLSQQTHVPLHSLLWITIKDNQVHMYD